MATSAVILGVTLFSNFSFNEAMATDKVVVVPLGSGKIYSFGDDNLFIGDNAGNHTLSGTRNIGIGLDVLHADTTGSYNTATGSWSLTSNTTGDYNNAFGRRALQVNTTGYNNEAFGYGALRYNTSGYYNTAVGSSALVDTTIGWENTAVGVNAGTTNVNGCYNTFIGYNADAGSSNLNNVTAIGTDATPTASNSVRIGNTFVTSIGGQVPWASLSDKRKKKDIQDISQGLAFISALRPVEFKLKQGNDRVDFGFLAQDIETLLGTKYNILKLAATRIGPYPFATPISLLLWSRLSRSNRTRLKTSRIKSKTSSRQMQSNRKSLRPCGQNLMNSRLKSKQLKQGNDRFPALVEPLSK